ncbi:MAG: sugar phosphate nucleotidyltransferase [Spirochaetia bacterium]
MNYICLAAGKGSRFGNLGRYLQKCMYTVLEKPFVEYSVKNCIESHSFNREKDRIVFVIGQHAGQLVQYFGTEYEGVPIDYAYQREPLGTGHAVALGYQKCREQNGAIIWQADNYIPAELFDQISSLSYEDTLTITHHVCEFTHNERVDIENGFISKAWKGTSDYIEAGLWKFSDAMIQSMTENKADEYRALLNVQHKIEQGVKVGYIENTNWLHLGGTEPTVRENIYQVVTEVMRLERKQ